MDFQQKDRYGILDLLEIMALLRGENGCPWDREQTHESIRHNFIEETYEVAEAIDRQDPDLLREELGDVLLQVVFHTEMEREAGTFSFDDVCDGICKKLILRHPHIFSDTLADTAEQVLQNWDEIKKKEKHQQTFTETLRSVPRVLPSLMRSEKIQSRAARSGFDYPDAAWAMKDLRSEVEEVQQALNGRAVGALEAELGDLLFAVVNVSRFAGVDAEQALEKACDKFVNRFAGVETLAAQKGIDMGQADVQLLDDLWQEVKNKEKQIFGGKEA